MKQMQILITVVAVLLGLALVTWLARSAPTELIVQSKKDDILVDPNETEAETDATEELEGDDFFESNPFDLDEPTGAKAVLVEETYEFDRMILGTSKSHEFKIRNEGTAPLKLGRGMAQCKCTVSGLKQQAIQPGEEGIISLEWKPTKTGPFTQGAIIWTNDPENSKLLVHATGSVYTEVEQSPSNWVLGTIRSDVDTTFKGTVYSSVRDDLEILKVETTSDDLTVEYEPFSEDDLLDFDAQSGYHLTGSLKAETKAGSIQERLTVTTNVERQPELNFNISATRSGPITIVGRGWYAAESMVKLETVKKEGVKRKLTMMVKPFSEPLKITKVESDPAFLKFEAKAEKMPANAPRERHSLTIEVPPDSPGGSWNHISPGRITIHTNHPDAPELTIKVTMNILK